MPTSTYSTQLFRGLIAGALATAMAVVIGACSPSAAQAPAAGALPGASIAAAVQPSVAITRDVPAQVVAAERIALRPRIGGIVKTVAFAEGARVRKGDLLVQLDPAPYAAALATARAELQRADAHARLVAAEAGPLLASQSSGGTSAAAIARRESLVAAARIRRDAAAAAVRRARLELRLTRIEAPIDGRIGPAEVTMGNLVGPQDHLAVLVGDERVFVDFELPAPLSGLPTRSDWQARFSVPDAADLSFEGPLLLPEDGLADGVASRRVRMLLPGHEALVPGRYGLVRLTFPVAPSIAQATP